MKKILVPTDFSPIAVKALDFAVHIAKKAKAEILLVHACCDLHNTKFKDNTAIYREHNQASIDAANEKLSILKKNIEDSEKLTVSIKLYNGSAIDTILQASEDHHADLIIMGTLGDSAIKKKIFGSKTAQIIGKTNVPVMVIPLLTEWDIPEKILLVVQDFEEQPDITNPVFELARLFNATVSIAKFSVLNSAISINYQKHERSISYKAKPKLQYKDNSIKYAPINDRRFKKTIEEFITTQRINIVAMVTNKRTFLKSIFNPSKAKAMCYSTPIPLLAIPSQKKKIIL